MSGLAEGEGIGRHMRVEKFDAEGAVLNPGWLTHQLVKALFGHGASAIRRHIGAMGIAWRLAVDRYLEAHRFTIGTRPQHQVQVTGMEAINHTPTGLIEGGLLAADIPLAFQSPVIQIGRASCRERV